MGSLGAAPCALVRRAAAGGAASRCRFQSCFGVRSLRGNIAFSQSIIAATLSSPSRGMRPRFGLSVSPLCELYCRRTLFSSSRVVRNYEDVPRDYRDQVGLPFSARDLTEEEVRRIFGSGLKAAAGNRLLRILHGRRVAGTLEDPALGVHTAQYPDELIARALAYLRDNVAVNEVLNAGLRAEDELNEMDREREASEKAQADENNKEDNKEDNEDSAGVAESDPVYGRSSFDRIRARNIAKQKAREKAAEQDRLARRRAEEDVGISGPLAKREDGTRAISNPKVAEYYEKAQSGLESPPELRAWQRILPSATVVTLVLGFLAAVAMVYDEPSPRYRLLRDMSTAHATVGTLIALNAIVYLGWRLPPLWSLFNRYMIFVVATVKPATLFTAMFSHTKLSHLLVNMVPLWVVGTALHEELGRADFLTLYLGCGALGFLGSLVTYTLRGWLTVTSLGASGATLGLVSAYFWEHRNDGFRIFGLPPSGVHGIVVLAMVTALQMAALGRTAKLKVDVASHLSGMAAGILGIHALNRAARTRRAAGHGKEVIEIWDQSVISRGTGGAKTLERR